MRLSARALNSRLVIVARAEGKSATAKTYRAGADHVVSPNRTGATVLEALNFALGPDRIRGRSRR